MIHTDRSRIEEYERCPRARYWHYEYKGVGIERLSKSVPLVLGSYIHDPLSKVVVAPPGEVPAIIKQAQDGYLEEVSKRGLYLDYFDGEDASAGQNIVNAQSWQVEEQLALLEALVLGWVKVRLPKLQEEYEVIMVETECPFQLGDDILFMTRADVVLKRRTTGEVFVVNYKTVSNPDMTWQQQWRYDQQTLSEVLGVEAKLGQKVTGVIIEGLVKGRRNVQFPRDSGRWMHNTPLQFVWKRAAAAPFPASYAASYEFRDATGKASRLGKGWERALVRAEIGIGDWLSQLESEAPDLLQSQFISLPPIIRGEYEVECWRRSVQTVELSIAAANQDVALGQSLDVHFPMHTSHGNCLRPGKCQFFDICHGVGDPDDLSQFIPRKPNHPQETQ